ncbi:nuclear transport factor 2 family protein [Actinomadura scrupuli]|uniref:nuclear transport factor 2 family protein n=1 Tax=Actinomadura scrupuli TaxID=559629 RepID=UPI003D99586B
MQELSTRISLRELVDRYAAEVDRRRPGHVAALFTEQGALLIHGPGDDEPRRAYTGRRAIEQALGGLNRFRVTSHLVAGQLLDPGYDEVTGETYCLASHVYDGDGGQRMYMMSIRYQDTFVREGERWLFAVRRERVDWAEDRPFEPRPV